MGAAAATGAYRLAKCCGRALTTSDIPATSKQGRPFLDFDLNVGVVDDASLNNAPSIRSVNRALTRGGWILI